MHIHTRSGNKNFNRNIEVKAVSGNAYIDISGHISEDIYAYTSIKYNARGAVVNQTAIDTPVVSQGKTTISEQIILYETQKFKYTLTTAEVVIMNIKSLDGNDVSITIIEGKQTREYKINGSNHFGQTILFKN
jgi:hypothetical protein